MPPTATLEDIKAYQQKVEKDKITPHNLPPCPRCSVDSSFFKIHAYRERRFLIIIEMLIKAAHCSLVRFICPGCGKTFTFYPDFAGSDHAIILIFFKDPSTDTRFETLEAHFHGQKCGCKEQRGLSAQRHHPFHSPLVPCLALGQMPAGFNRRRMIAIFPISALISKENPLLNSLR
jgi:hypothetical protein